MDNFRMNRTVTSKQTFAEADDHTSFYDDKTPLERLQSACFIINSIYRVTPETKVNRTQTFKRKHEKSV